MALRKPPLNLILKTPNRILEEKMAVVNARKRGNIQDTVMPLPLGLASATYPFYPTKWRNAQTWSNTCAVSTQRAAETESASCRPCYLRQAPTTNASTADAAVRAGTFPASRC